MAELGQINSRACRHCKSPARFNPCWWHLDHPKYDDDAPCWDDADHEADCAYRRYLCNVRLVLTAAIAVPVAIMILRWWMS